jgi:hypothetical protein
MTALAYDLPRAGSADLTTRALSVPVDAATTIYQGAMVAVAVGGSGYAVNASADRALRVIGVAAKRAVNTSAEGFGSAGDINVEVERGVFPFTNSSSTDAITAADVGEPCYVVDNDTVARTSNFGLRPTAGIVSKVENSKVFVEIGATQRMENGVTDYMAPAAADYSSTGRYRFVNLNGSSKFVRVTAAGANAFGVLQNAPVADAIAIVRRRGPSYVVAGDTIADGDLLAVEVTNSRAKVAVAATVTGGAGDPGNDPLDGSFVMGTALMDGAAGDTIRMDIHPMGAIPTTAV